jgi:2-polyprenyl-6-methoxyphenol hydroxylase-like FAD-dependent oxidoreductase
MQQTDVLIIGAGPTGLVLALWLTKQGRRVRIIDQSSGPGETSRAMVVQARTLELYQQLDLTDAVIGSGFKTPAMNIWAIGKRKTQIRFVDAGSEISPYPFVLVFPQDKHEHLLVERLRAMGVKVERETQLVSVTQSNDEIIAVLRHKDGREESCQSTYLAGSDGARSLVRRQIGSRFDGGTYDQLFYVADIEATGIIPSKEAHIALDKSDFILLMYYGDGNKYRLIGTVRDDRALQPDKLSFDDVGKEAISSLNLSINKVNWFSTYKVHHRVTDHFRRGRSFLLGDAAHVHSPAGGQGMNTGIQDAINLAWKLAAVIKKQAPDALLDTYATERQAFAKKLVETTDRVFTFATAQGSFANFARTRIAPAIASFAYSFGSLREFIFRTVSQTSLSYPNSSMSSGKAGKIEGGDRLPWVAVPDSDNYLPLAEITWQVHVYGVAKSDLKAWCERHQILLHEFEWSLLYEKAGLARDAVYLLRPDTYVAMADAGASVTKLEEYFKSREMFEY